MAGEMIEFQENDPLSILVDRLRQDLRARGYAFGALFTANLNGEGPQGFGLYFAHYNPEHILQICADLRKSIDALEKRMRV